MVKEVSSVTVANFVFADSPLLVRIRDYKTDLKTAKRIMLFIDDLVKSAELIAKYVKEGRDIDNEKVEINNYDLTLEDFNKMELSAFDVKILNELLEDKNDTEVQLGKPIL